jgi:NAD(P)-dependent dehydrogenase (short-subunit alcohol dehydrogenase family)
MNKVIVVIGAGSIGQAIARRVSTGKKVLLADLRQENAEKAALVMRDAGFDVTTAAVDVAKRQTVRTLVEQATALGEVTGLIHAAGVSPTPLSWRSICTEPPWCWRNSAISSRATGPVWSLPHSLVTGSLP